MLFYSITDEYSFVEVILYPSTLGHSTVQKSKRVADLTTPDSSGNRKRNVKRLFCLGLDVTNFNLEGISIFDSRHRMSKLTTVLFDLHILPHTLRYATRLLPASVTRDNMSHVLISTCKMHYNSKEDPGRTLSPALR